MNLQGIDFSCAVEWCKTIPEDRRSGIYCSHHHKLKIKHGTPTPIVNCYGCGLKLIRPKAFRMRFYCDECLTLTTTYEHLTPKISQLSSYGINRVSYIKMLIAQDFSCKMCRKKKRLVIDHDHSCCPPSTGKRSCGKCIRGLICYSCNTFIGIYEDSPIIISQLERYLG